MNGGMWRRTKVGRWLVLAGGVLVLLALGASCAEWAAARQDRWMRDDLQYQTRLITQTLHLDQVQRLAGNETDIGKPEYRRLKEQLMAAQQINPGWKWIYLMGRQTNGTVFFQVDSEAFDAPDPSLPGQTYEEASAALQGVFDTGQSGNEGPISDRWGVWVSAYMPLKNPATGELISVVGIDIDARLWNQMRSRAMRLPVLLCLALIAIWLGGAFLLARRTRASTCTTWFCTHIESGLAVATGLILTLTAVWLTHCAEMRNQKLAFRHLANIEVAPMISAAMGLRNLELEGLAAFFENSEAVSAQEFQRYTAHLSGISEVLDWSWVEVVPASQRAQFEENTVRQTGQLDYRIWEKNAQALPMAASERELYYPIVYMAPKPGHPFALGFDIGSDPLRRAAVESANQTRLPFVSDPIAFRPISEGEKGIFVLRPLFHTNAPAQLKGFVAADLKIKSWLSTSRKGNLDRRPMAILDLFQLEANQPPLWLGSTAEPMESQVIHFDHIPAMSIVTPLLLFGQTYAIVAHPTSNFMAMNPTLVAGVVALAGLVVTAALAWVLGIFAQRRENLVRRVDEQHHELATAMYRYEALISASNTGAWEYNDTTGHLWCSPEYFSLLGRDLRDFDTTPDNRNIVAFWLDLMHPDDRFQARARLIDYLKNPAGMYVQTFRMRHQDGHWVWIWARGQVLRDPNGKPTPIMVGTHIDISEAKRAEAELRESRRQYAALLANLPGMAYRCANDRERTMEFVSDGCLELTGYAPDNLVGNKTLAFNEIIQTPYREFLWNQWQLILETHGIFENEYEIHTQSGESKWVWEQGEGVYAEDGHLVAIEGFITDITARKRAEIERERLTRAIEQSRETVVITDALGAILYVNPAFTKVTGYSREEALGLNPRVLKSGQHDAAFYREMWETLSAGNTWEGQIINKSKAGTLFTEQASLSPVRDAAGRIVHFVAVKRDITAQLHEQEEKAELQSQLSQAQKMESIGRLAGGVAHDFNNMLQAILGYTEMALEQVDASQPLHFDLKEIQKAARRSALLTHQLQAFACKQTVVPKVLNLNDAVEGMSSMLRRLIGENIPMVWKPAPDLGLIKMDPSQLDQVVTNLCINASAAIEKSGHILIETRHAELDQTVHGMHGDIAPGHYVVLSVTDDGSGMAKNVLLHIFEPFFTTKKTGKGTGLGLATVYGIVKQNHGGILVESKRGQGSTFQIFLPRHIGEISPSDLASEGEAPTSCGDETILVVEDEQNILQATRRMLESLGYRVLATLSSVEALRLAEEHKDQIQLLLTDVIMPEMNGPELAQRLQTQYPKLKHMFMSGYTANLIEKHGVKADHLNFVQKPFSRKTLAHKVRIALDGT